MRAIRSTKLEPAEISHKHMRFLIMDRPTDGTLDKFIEVSLYENVMYMKKVTV